MGLDSDSHVDGKPELLLIPGVTRATRSIEQQHVRNLLRADQPEEFVANSSHPFEQCRHVDVGCATCDGDVPMVVRTLQKLTDPREDVLDAQPSAQRGGP